MNLEKGGMKMVVTCNIGLKNDIEKEFIEDVCKDIGLKDRTFKYDFIHCRYGKYKWILKILCKDADEAHQRGMWFNKKVGLKDDEGVYHPFGLLYWIDIKGGVKNE